jgi:flagellar secretion chaperone FliS
MHTSPFAPDPAARGARAYLTVDAQSRSPLELVVMLYDGAIRFLGQARDAQTRGDNRGRAQGVSRALAIVSELQNTLDVERGCDIAGELDRIYHYVTRRLLDVTTTGDVAALDEVLQLIGTLREGWAQASQSAPAGA